MKNIWKIVIRELVKAEHGATESGPIKVFTNSQITRRGFTHDVLHNGLVQYYELVDEDEG